MKKEPDQNYQARLSDRHDPQQAADSPFRLPLTRMFSAEPGDWEEDRDLENGNYMGRCLSCERQFIGHKDRWLCKTCDTENRERWERLSPEERSEWERRLLKEIEAYLNTPTCPNSTEKQPSVRETLKQNLVSWLCALKSRLAWLRLR